MTWIKICGITNLDDALAAVDAGADALGFVFYEKSARNVAPQTVREIVRQLPEGVEKVGVIVKTHPADFLGVVHETGLTACQMQLGYGDETSENKTPASQFFPPPAGFRLYRSVPAGWFMQDEKRMQDFASSFAKVERSFSSPEQGRKAVERFRTIFLDSGTPQEPGGTGKTFDWQRAVGVVEYLQRDLKVVIAGGLTADNVAEAMRLLHPWGVDVSSGVESKPGKKDHEKIRAFINAVREADKASSNN